MSELVMGGLIGVAICLVAGLAALWPIDRLRVERERRALTVQFDESAYRKWADGEISADDYWAYLNPQRGENLLGRDEYMSMLHRLGFTPEQAEKFMAERERAVGN